MGDRFHAAELINGAVMYNIRKGSIVGPAFKMPFIGPFLESMDPKFEQYHAKWMSGPLSCVSVFHKYARFSQKFECLIC